MLAEVGVVEGLEIEEQYVCFLKSHAGDNFRPYTEKGHPDKFTVRPIRDFLDHEISRWLKASESEKTASSVLLKVSADNFFADVAKSGINSVLASMLGWNYAKAARIVEKEGWVLILTAHPRFESRPYSFCGVRDNDADAMLLVEELLSIRGGEIVFEKYDPEKHVAGYRYEA